MKIAGFQMDVAIGDVKQNVDCISSVLRETARAGAELTVFPECAATGYCFSSRAEAQEFAEPVPGPITAEIAEVCRETAAFAVIGMLEADGEKLFNAAVLIGPEGVIGSYRKVHLPYLGVDMFTDYGDRPFAALDAGPIRIGLNICYDASFPEAARCLGLDGADLIVLPTNWPPGSECVAEHTIRSRAVENGVYYAAVNRVGVEREFRFIGMSSICAPGGEVLAATDGVDEQIIYAEIDPARSRRKRVVRVAGKHEIDRLADRRPEMYGQLTQPHNLSTPRADHA